MLTALAALLRVARVGITERFLGVDDRDEAVGAADGVTEQVAALVHVARVGIAHGVLGVVDRSEAVGAADGVAEQLATTAFVPTALATTVRPCANC